jgi:hypothetical protein
MAHKKNNNALITRSKDNTETEQPLSPFSDGNAGLDTVTLSFPIDLNSVEAESSLWTIEDYSSFKDSGRQRQKFVGTLKKDYADIRVTLFPGYERIQLHFNAARLISPKSATLLPPEALVPLVEAIIDEISVTVRPVFDVVDYSTGTITRDPNWRHMVCFTRLDLARNFVIDQPAELRRALEATKPKYGKTLHMYWDFNGGWTLNAATKRSGHDRFYDKAAELRNFCVEETIGESNGLYRYETQLEGERLNTFGLKTLADVTNDRVWNALEERWTALGWGVMIAEPNSIIAATRHLPPAEQDALIGFLYKAHLGDFSGYTDSRRRMLNSKAKQCGLIPGLPLELIGVGQRILSLDAGKFIDL